ncbi:MAG: cytochrome c biogenesis heme-transporting ATPase CcmA [Cocleimonas sp.]|nr:cytochrome c biogenesis heme-transporting ATPase CcmA [Cocleimonas sp.]
MSLTVSNLQCTRGDRQLFSGLNLQLSAKQLLFLEGRNGSGKTTLIRTLCALFVADKGDILWQGQSIEEHLETYHNSLFYLGHLNAIKGDLTALENLRFNHTMSGQDCSDDELLDALERIGLFGYEDYPTRQLSQGQKRRVALARLIVNKSPLWILDEPFVALDIAAVELLQQIISQHIETGGMAIITTHQAVPLTEGKVQHLNLDDYAATSGMESYV